MAVNPDVNLRVQHSPKTNWRCCREATLIILALATFIFLAVIGVMHFNNQNPCGFTFGRIAFVVFGQSVFCGLLILCGMSSRQDPKVYDD